jgi:hypothetical protein
VGIELAVNPRLVEQCGTAWDRLLSAPAASLAAPVAVPTGRPEWGAQCGRGLYH